MRLAFSLVCEAVADHSRDLVLVNELYRLHRATGQAFVTLSGDDVYLGTHGSATSRRRYDVLLTAWLSNGRQALDRSDVTRILRELTLAEVQLRVDEQSSADAWQSVAEAGSTGRVQATSMPALIVDAKHVVAATSPTDASSGKERVHRANHLTAPDSSGRRAASSSSRPVRAASTNQTRLAHSETAAAPVIDEALRAASRIDPPRLFAPPDRPLREGNCFETLADYSTLLEEGSFGAVDDVRESADAQSDFNTATVELAEQSDAARAHRGRASHLLKSRSKTAPDPCVVRTA
jgi:hypothetical protein